MRTYPHHLTADLPPLPVPSLQESLERFRIASGALYDAETEGDVNQTIADFVIGAAPGLQTTLEEYADAMAELGSNWMAEQWLERYLRVREPLQLTTNVTYQLELPTATTGVPRVVELLQRIGSVHILQAKRETPAETDAAGRRLSMDGWAAFNGGIRTPEAEVDVWMRAGTGATYRTIGIIYLGRLWEVPLTGSHGKLLNTEHLKASIEYVLDHTEPAAQSAVGYSSRGSANLALELPWEAPANKSLYSRLANMLFTLTLDPEAGDDPATLHRWAFASGNTWVYKPISYLAALDQQMLAAHVERSILDSGTLTTAVARMQQVALHTLDTQYDPQLSRAEELRWEDVTQDLTAYTTRAAALRSELVVVRRDTALPYAIDADARAQLVLMIAQQLTFGQLRAHAQLCDMRRYRAGRTEVIRPVTLAASNFVTALTQDRATEAQFTAAIAAHLEWVEAAQQSQVFDRHMFMMQHIGAELGGGNAEIFSKYPRAAEHFIFTTTLSTPEVIRRAIVAPAVDDGFGVHCVDGPAGTEFVVTWQTGTPGAEDFHRNLGTAAELLYDFIGSLTPVVDATA